MTVAGYARVSYNGLMLLKLKILSKTRKLISLLSVSKKDSVESGYIQINFNSATIFQAVNKACMLIYTSGTTGPPKGMTLTIPVRKYPKVTDPSNVL